MSHHPPPAGPEESSLVFPLLFFLCGEWLNQGLEDETFLTGLQYMLLLAEGLRYVLLVAAVNRGTVWSSRLVWSVLDRRSAD